MTGSVGGVHRVSPSLVHLSLLLARLLCDGPKVLPELRRNHAVVLSPVADIDFLESPHASARVTAAALRTGLRTDRAALGVIEQKLRARQISVNTEPWEV